MYMVNHNEANSADADQTAPRGAVCSVSTLFAVFADNLKTNYCKIKLTNLELRSILVNVKGAVAIYTHSVIIQKNDQSGCYEASEAIK